MRLQPLKQWICDTCGEAITTAKHGWVEWLYDESRRRYGFRIVHHLAHSPRSVPTGCYQYQDEQNRADMHLDHLIGDQGIVCLLAMLDPGPHHVPNYTGPEVVNVREWVELYRRLFLPYYEEARLYLDTALSDELFAGANEVYIFLPDTLREVIQKNSQAA